MICTISVTAVRNSRRLRKARWIVELVASATVVAIGGRPILASAWETTTRKKLVLFAQDAGCEVMPMGLLDELERLEKASTPGPWAKKPVSRYFYSEDGLLIGITQFDEGDDIDRYPTLVASYDNAAFIVAVRNALPQLIEVIKEARPIIEIAEACADDGEPVKAAARALLAKIETL
jgi:hypothetical protein